MVSSRPAASSRCKAGRSIVAPEKPPSVISCGQAHPAFAPLAVDEGLAGFTLRLQRIEFLIEPLLGGFACGDRAANLELRVCRWSLTELSAGLGANQSTRPLGQTKEPWARPMRSGDPLGNHGQRAIMPAFIFEPVLTHEHSVGVSAPLAH
jgi:hypothetical protein